MHLKIGARSCQKKRRRSVGQFLYPLMEESMLKGKVARILNSREVALNIGADAGVEVGMRFDILSDKAGGNC